VPVAGGLEPREVFTGRDDVAARALHRLDIERAVFGGPGLRVPDGVVFALEELFELALAVDVARWALEAVDAPEAVRIEDELRAVAEMAVAPPVAIARSDGRRSERSPVIAAHESEHQVLAGRVAHDLERVLDGLRAAHVELHAPLHPEALFAILRDARRDLDLLRVQVL